MKAATRMIALTILLVASIPISSTTALLPTFTGYVIDNKDPLTSRSVAVTVFIDIYADDGNDQSGYWGTLTLYLYWSRDKQSWFSVTASATDAETYLATIPAQDGSDNRYYADGAGILYWYIRMVNSLNQEDFYFSQDDPNSEITFHELGESTDTSTTTPVQFQAIPLEQQLFNIINDPLAPVVVLFIAFVLVFLIASRGYGTGIFRVLFRR
ncbi:MAG: hypothetical protein ACFFD4_08190 [Candidatus Odinarchaeota archaeon]